MLGAPLRSLVLMLLTVSIASAQGPAVLERLREGKLVEAVAQLDKAGAIASVEFRFEAIGLLVDLAHEQPDKSDVRRDALTHAARLAMQSVPSEHGAARNELCARAGLALDACLRDAKLDTETLRTRVNTLTAAREALIALDRGNSDPARDAALTLLPLLLERKSWGEAVRVGEDLLGMARLDVAQQRPVRGMVGIALLRKKKTKEALPYLEDYLARAPQDPELVFPVIDALPLAHADRIYRFVRPVLDAPPDRPDETWTHCLQRTYEALDHLGMRRDPARSLYERNTTDRPLPQIWGQRTWQPGYRVWRPDNAVPGKTYSGKKSLRAILPVSAGWRKVGAPPRDLLRWNNHAICFERSPGGPTLILYWYAPDLHYWYGDTPRTRGVTGKTARGHSRGAIASLVAEIAYKVDAGKQKLRFRTARPLPIKPAVGSSLRKAWRLGDELYDETFFSIGQVTVEVLLRIRDSDYELLEPEIRWLYANIRAPG